VNESNVCSDSSDMSNLRDDMPAFQLTVIMQIF